MTDEKPKQRLITVVKKYPAYRDSFVYGPWKWIEGKVKDDYAEGLWRVNDKLYNLTDFANHPGGQFWLEITKGTDITEAFESHHISTKPRDLLKKYYVRDAVDPRNYFFTFDENGFYQTLKKRIAKKLQNVDKSVTWKSRFIHDVNLFTLFVAGVMMNRCENQFWIVFWNLLASQCFAWSASFSHNFVHQADNWRMFTANLTLSTWRDCRVSHVLSHHMYPNSYSDYEVSCFEPYYKWIPTQTKSWFYKIFAILITPVLHVTFFHNMWRYRAQGYIWAKERLFQWDELMSLLLPTAMLILGKGAITSSTISETYLCWAYIALPAEFLFSFVFFNRGHHGTEVVHQNDEIKSFDFGEYQLSTSYERVEANRNIFTSLAYSGDQALHHLFPTLDAAILPQLRETFKKTCKEFDVELHGEKSMLKATIDQFKQLFRSETIKCS